MPIQIFGHRMNDNMRAKLNRPLQVRAQECVVDHHRDASLGRELAQSTKVRDAQRGIRRRFHIQHFCIWPQCSQHRVVRRSVHEREFKSEVHQKLRGEPENSPVDRLRDHNVIPGA